MLLRPQQPLGQSKWCPDRRERDGRPTAEKSTVSLTLDWLLKHTRNPDVEDLCGPRSDLSTCCFCQQPREMGRPLTWKFGKRGPNLELQPVVCVGSRGSHLTSSNHAVLSQNEVLHLNILKFVSHVLTSYQITWVLCPTPFGSLVSFLRIPQLQRAFSVNSQGTFCF